VGETAALLRTVDEPLCREVAAIPTSSCATINLVYRTADLPRPLDGYGFVCPQVEGRSLLACTFSSRKYEGRCDDAWSILRGYVQDGLDRPEQDVIATVRSDLKDLMGLTAEPVVARFARWDGVFPQYRTGHLDRVDRIERLASALPGFALAGNAYRGVGISDCVESARRASREVIAALATVPVG
jgi:oxygen-dependent protoporphyrinogen oxidase